VDRRGGRARITNLLRLYTKGNGRETQEADTTHTLRPHSPTGYFLVGAPFVRDAPLVCAILPVVTIALIFLYSSFVRMFFSTS
jgi:hypothetical protein